MTILMTTDSVGGGWTHAVDLSRGLIARGDRVVLAALGPPLTGDQREQADQISGLTLAARPSRLEWMDEPWADVDRAGAWLLDLAHAAAPDVVHINGFTHAALPFPAPVLVGAHACVFSWFHAVRNVAPSSRWQRYEQAVRRGLAAARVIVAPSRARALAIIRHYAPVTPIIVVHHGRHPAGFSPAIKEPFVLTTGPVWDETMNLAQLAAAAPGVPWPIVVAGDESPGLEGLTPLGRLGAPDVAAWLGRAGIFARPARYEPFGHPVVEAALSGCALVLGDIPSQRELWDGAATFVDPDDGRGFGRALESLISDPTHRELMALLALDRAQQYGLDEMAAAYGALYRQLASTPAHAIPVRLAGAS